MFLNTVVPTGVDCIKKRVEDILLELMDYPNHLRKKREMIATLPQEC